MINLNRAMIIGNMTRDPEMRYTPSGRAVLNFGVATNRRWTNQEGGQQEEVEFHDIVAWGKLAEIISPILKKGDRAYVEGRLKTRSWEGQDGVKRQRTEIIADNIIALTPRSMSGIPASSPAPVSPVSPEISANAEVSPPAPDVEVSQEKKADAAAESTASEKPADKELPKKSPKKLADSPANEGEISLDDIEF